MCGLFLRRPQARRFSRNPAYGDTRRASRARRHDGWCASPSNASGSLALARSRRPRLRRRCALRATSLFPIALVETRLQPRHKIEDSAVDLFHGLLELGFFPAHLRLDHLHQVSAVVVGVTGRIERLGEILDELLGHLELLRANLGGLWKGVLVRVDELVGKAHDLEHHRIAKHFDSREVLCLPDNDLADAHYAAAPDCLSEQSVGFLGAFRRDEVVRGLEISWVDLFLLHEVENVESLRALERGGLEVFIGEDDELSLLVLVSLDDFIPRDGFTLGRANALVLYGGEIILVEHSKTDVIGAD